MDVFYGTGYRKEAEIVDPSEAPDKKTHKQQFDADINDNIKELSRVWTRAMTGGGLQGTGAE